MLTGGLHWPLGGLLTAFALVVCVAQSAQADPADGNNCSESATEMVVPTDLRIRVGTRVRQSISRPRRQAVPIKANRCRARRAVAGGVISRGTVLAMYNSRRHQNSPALRQARARVWARGTCAPCTARHRRPAGGIASARRSGRTSLPRASPPTRRLKRPRCW
jgi:hypothetical protein